MLALRRTYARLIGIFKSKRCWALLMIAACTLIGFDRYLMWTEARVFQVGSTLRGSLHDFGEDFAAGDRSLASYFHASFTGSDLGFDTRTISSQEHGVVVETWQASGSRHGAETFFEQLRNYRSALHEVETAKFKLVFLNQCAKRAASALVRFQVYATNAEGRKTEDRGHFEMDFVLEKGQWRITRQELLDGNRVIESAQPHFVDVTREVGIDFNTGANELFKHQRYSFGIVDRAAGGVTSGDYNNDGWSDLFLAGPAGCKLYRNTGSGAFTDVTREAGLDCEEAKHAQGCVFADYDNDGDLDLFVTKTPQISNRLFRNNGDGTFTDVTVQAGLEWGEYCTTAGFADIDNDGDLDLYVGAYGYALQNSPDPPFHDRKGVPDRLYRNNGDGTFADITQESNVADVGWALGMTFWDYDNDGDQDIYVANDFGPNSLFQNDGKGKFVNVARNANALDYGFGMSASPGDYDNDGDLDMYVSNIYSGTNWYIERSIMQFYWVRLRDPTRAMPMLITGFDMLRNLGGPGSILSVGRKFGEGNSLLENLGNGQFASVGVQKGVHMGGWAWGSNFFDFDNDGDLDIHCVNGLISQARETDL